MEEEITAEIDDEDVKDDDDEVDEGGAVDVAGPASP